MKAWRICCLLVFILCMLPLLSVVAAGWIATEHGCQLDEGNPHPCIVDGEDIGNKLYAMGVMGWFMLLTLPFAAFTVLCWLLSEIVNFLRKKNTAAMPQHPQGS